jgi:hypothetical protein
VVDELAPGAAEGRNAAGEDRPMRCSPEW